MEIKSITLPKPTQDQMYYLERIRAAGEDYDGSYVVGGPRTFWVLEDMRCNKWSPTPQYLHRDAPFYDAWPHNWGQPGGGGECQTGSIQDARRFTSVIEAKNFMAEHGRNVGMPDSWIAREHQFINRS